MTSNTSNTLSLTDEKITALKESHAAAMAALKTEHASVVNALKIKIRKLQESEFRLQMDVAEWKHLCEKLRSRH
jgi:hypothetical protein